MLKYCWIFSLAKLMQNCSKLFCSKISKPLMSRMPMTAFNDRYSSYQHTHTKKEREREGEREKERQKNADRHQSVQLLEVVNGMDLLMRATSQSNSWP